MKYTLKVETKNNGSFIYTVVDENGNIISTRKSKRTYVACTFNGVYYFGRLDLIGKGEHGEVVKNRAEAGKEPIPIAYIN